MKHWDTYETLEIKNSDNSSYQNKPQMRRIWSYKVTLVLPKSTGCNEFTLVQLILDKKITKNVIVVTYFM